MTDRELMQMALEALEIEESQTAYPGRWLTNAITAIREALAEQPAQQQGWKLVPVEPTPEMLKAADDGDDEYTRRNFGPAVHRVMQGPYDHYIAMLNAAPQPAQQQEPVYVRDEENVSYMFTATPRLEQMDQEPVAKVCHDLDGHIGWNPNLTQLPDEGTPLYTSPPIEATPLASQSRSDVKPWVGLTEDERADLRYEMDIGPDAVIKATEAKLREKNA